MLQKTFEELGISENAYIVYAALLEKGALTARQIAESIAIPRPSVYDNIKQLINAGLVSEFEEGNKKKFQVEDITNISRLLATKIQNLEKEKKILESSLPTFVKQVHSIQPRIKFYSGVEGVKQVLNEFKWDENIETMSMWPISEMIEVLGKEYFEDLNKARIKRKIYTRAIWPIDKKVSLKENPFMGVGKEFFREVRLAPKGMTWNMGYWIYREKTAFISSKQEIFGFIVHSKDFRDIMKAQFEEIWKMSKPIKPEPKYTDNFLKSIQK